MNYRTGFWAIFVTCIFIMVVFAIAGSGIAGQLDEARILFLQKCGVVDSTLTVGQVKAKYQGLWLDSCYNNLVEIHVYNVRAMFVEAKMNAERFRRINTVKDSLTRVDSLTRQIQVEGK